jgi:hypothetical protein
MVRKSAFTAAALQLQNGRYRLLHTCKRSAGVRDSIQRIKVKSTPSSLWVGWAKGGALSWQP